MVILIGLVVGILIVAIIIVANILYVRLVEERRKPPRSGDGQFSVGKTPDYYGTPTMDAHGGPF